MPHTIRQLAELVQGEVHGNGDEVVRAARCLSEAGEGDVTFLENATHAHLLAASKASAVVVGRTQAVTGKTLIRVTDPLAAFVIIYRCLSGQTEPPVHGVDVRAAVHPSVQLGPNASIYPFAVVGENAVIGARCRIYSGAVVGRNCRLGDDNVLYPNVVLYDGTHLGNRVVVHANAVVGSDGFGYRLVKGRHVKVPQLGRVEVGDDVEIGAGSTIDRGTFQTTHIGEGTKIDNLVQIAHNVRIGRHNLLVSQVGVAGSSSTGEYVVVAGQAGISDHVHVGERTIVGGQSGVHASLAPDQRVWGTPALPEWKQKRMLLTMPRLPQMHRDLQRVLKHLGLEEEERKAS